jgi:hypothetical protein
MKHTGFLACALAGASLMSLAGCAGSSGISPHPGGLDRTQSIVHAYDTVPTHVMTMDSYQYSSGKLPDRSVAARYLTWAIVQPLDANSFSAVGIKTMLYTDPNRTSVGDPMYTNDETTFAHDCSNNRITIPGKSATTYLMDPTSADLQALWRQYVANILTWGDHYDAILEDNADVVHPVSTLPCNFDQTVWTAATNSMNQALGASVIYNGLGNLADGDQYVSPAIGLNPTSITGELEGCYSNGDPNSPVPRKTVWETFETTEIDMVTANTPFLCRGLGTLPSATAQSERIYMYASFLMTYDPNTSIISEQFATQNTGLMVDPESGFVALDPLVPEPSAITALESSNWVFGRQFADCYLFGRAVGACAAVVNADSSKFAHPFPWPGVYAHSLVLHGGAILDGGRAGVRGGAPPAQVPGASAVIAIQ